MLRSFFRFVVRYVNVFRPRVCYEKNHTSHALLNLRASRSDLMPHVLFFLCVLVTRLSRFWKKTFTNKKKVGFNPQISYKRTIQKTWWLEYIRGLTQTSMYTNSWALNIWHEEIMQFLARSVRKGKLYNGAMHNICYPNLRSLWIHEDVFVENESFFSNIRIEPCRIKNQSELNHFTCRKVTAFFCCTICNLYCSVMVCKLSFSLRKCRSRSTRSTLGYRNCCLQKLKCR